MTSLRDTQPPDAFQPIVSQSPDLFDGKLFLVFAAQDKQSGVLYYEVQEAKARTPFGRLFAAARGEWVRAESPYLLSDQKLESVISVKAVDRAGNTQVEILTPSRLWSRYDYYALLLLLLLGAGFAFAARQYFPAVERTFFPTRKT